MKVQLWVELQNASDVRLNTFSNVNIYNLSNVALSEAMGAPIGQEGSSGNSIEYIKRKIG